MLDFFENSDDQYDYTVAWLDCLARGDKLGRGIFTRGNHNTSTTLPTIPKPRNSRSIPFTFPPGCLNRLSVGIFNNLYFRKLMGPEKKTCSSYDPFFYPLDSIHHWNRLYGPKGFLQYQCVLIDDAENALKDLLDRIAKSGLPSPLNVLKKFGDRRSPGMLSFPRPGLSLAVDIPNCGERTLKLCNELDAVVKESAGALYPCKDSRMPPEMFIASFPRLDEFVKFMDPGFSSSFWRRVRP
jgi:hypothetical protein